MSFFDLFLLKHLISLFIIKSVPHLLNLLDLLLMLFLFFFTFKLLLIEKQAKILLDMTVLIIMELHLLISHNLATRLTVDHH